PTNGLITIQTGSVNNATVEVFNAVGQLVLTEKANSSAITLQLPEENGMYLIRVTANGTSSTQRVIKQ
ncbi:MAG: Secretion system C-terminal sorting domain, partial [Bacteroidota bacterium]